MREITTHVPATTANIGPGFDCLGIALALGNRVRVTDGSDAANGMAADAAEKFFAASGRERFDFAWSIEGDVPQSRGMGSSVTVRLGLLHGLNELAGRPLDAVRLFDLCAELEGHPDNAAPAAFGGFAVSKQGAKPIVAPVDESLSFVLLIPDFEVSTPEARKVLPATLDRKRAVESCVNACRITAAFLTRDYASLRGAFTDHLHQPHREPLIPFLTQVIAAGEKAGALGGWLSGSGSTICCLAADEPERVAAAMLAIVPGARTIITRVDNTGTRRV
ncbi:MAG: homoserine kinase [Chthoniobacteraceae bacterium]